MVNKISGESKSYFQPFYVQGTATKLIIEYEEHFCDCTVSFVRSGHFFTNSRKQTTPNFL